MWKTLEKCVYTVLNPQVSVTFKWNTKSEDTEAFKTIIGPNGCCFSMSPNRFWFVFIAFRKSTLFLAPIYRYFYVNPLKLLFSPHDVLGNFQGVI